MRSGQRKASAFGSNLGEKPLGALLIGAHESCATGVLNLTWAAMHATVAVRAGRIEGVSIQPEPALARASGEPLLEKVVWLFGLADETIWSFRDRDREPVATSDGQSLDPWRALWRGLVSNPPRGQIKKAIERFEGNITLRDPNALYRFGLPPDEEAMCRRLAHRASNVAHVIESSGLPVERAELLLYMLALARCLTVGKGEGVGPVELGREALIARARNIKSEDAHTALGLSPGASIDAVRAAYFRLARLYHPARLPPDLSDLTQECGAILSHITQAHQLLATPRESFAPAPRLSLVPSASMRDVDDALDRNDFAKAEGIARSLVAAGTDGPGARAVVAWCEARGGQASTEVLVEALASLDRVLAGDPDCRRALLYRGRVLRHLGRADDALRDFKKIVRLTPQGANVPKELEPFRSVPPGSIPGGTIPPSRGSLPPVRGSLPPARGSLPPARASLPPSRPSLPPRAAQSGMRPSVRPRSH